jgi:hypothetical protein
MDKPAGKINYKVCFRYLKKIFEEFLPVALHNDFTPQEKSKINKKHQRREKNKLTFKIL